MTYVVCRRRVRVGLVLSRVCAAAQYMRRLGARSPLSCVDVYGVDDALLQMVPQPVRAVLLLFPISQAVSA